MKREGGRKKSCWLNPRQSEPAWLFVSMSTFIVNELTGLRQRVYSRGMKQTKPQAYRISDEVDGELRRLAKVHGGIDKALRVLMGQEVAARPSREVTGRDD